MRHVTCPRVLRHVATGTVLSLWDRGRFPRKNTLLVASAGHDIDYAILLSISEEVTVTPVTVAAPVAVPADGDGDRDAPP